MNLSVVCLHELFEILLHGRFPSEFVCFFFNDVIYLYERERRKSMSESGRGRGRSRFPAKQGACLGTWIMICAYSRSLTEWTPRCHSLFLSFFLFLSSFIFNNNFIFYWCQFANIQNNTHCSFRQVPPSVPITHSPPLPAILPFSHP